MDELEQVLDQMAECTRCGAQIMKTDTFCWSCGDVLPVAHPATCGKCNRTLSRDWIACPYCGMIQAGITIKICPGCKKMFKTSNPDRKSCFSCEKGDNNKKDAGVSLEQLARARKKRR